MCNKDLKKLIEEFKKQNMENFNCLYGDLKS